LVAFLAVGLWRLVLTLVALSAVELVSMALSRLVITLVALLGVEPWLLLITLEALSAVELVRMALPTMVCSGMGSSLEAWKTAVLSDMVLWRLVLTLVVLLAVALSLLVITLVALLLGAVAAGDRVDGLIVCRAGIPGGGDGGVLRHGRRVDAIEVELTLVAFLAVVLARLALLMLVALGTLLVTVALKKTVTTIWKALVALILRLLLCTL